MGAATAFMVALAGGAVWCLVSLYVQARMPWFAFVIALFVAWALRSHGTGGPAGATLAALSVLLATAYAACLQAVAQIASRVGMPMGEAFARMDPWLALDVARWNANAWSVTMALLAALLAGTLAWHGPRRRHPP
jgi:hypothetical protein